MSETTENTTDVSIRQIVSFNGDDTEVEYHFMVLDTCGRLWHGWGSWDEDGNAHVSYVRVPVPQVPADPPPADKVAQLRAELTLSEYRYEALLTERDKLKDELDACNEFLSRES
jgi:hypothetical protein